MPAEVATQVSLWEVYDAWLRRVSVLISESAEALDAMNVFPVPDSDTGSNLELTVTGIADSVPDVHRGSLNALVQAAILSAHGNSGAIVAEMFASVARSLESDSAALRDLEPGRLVARLLRTVATAATRAVARPVAGTILTVADAAADAADLAAFEHSDDALAVARSAASGAHRALARTPELLDVLAEAGVVDAGGQGYVLLLDALVEVLGGPIAEPVTSLSGDGHRPRPGSSSTTDRIEYEVMYALRGWDAEALERLRTELSVLGHSVVVVGDRAVAQVHVHLADAGAAIEAALGHGSLSQVRITALPAVSRAERAVLAVVAGPGIAAAVAESGGIAVRPARRELSVDELDAAAQQTRGDLIVLPNDMASLEIAQHLAGQWRRQGRRVAVIPTVAQVQGLAAVAVHEPTADFDTVVVAMSSAAAHTRHGAVTVAESSAMTMAGRCEPGDVLGLVEGDFVEIGDSALDVGYAIAERLLATGAELVTVVRGAGADDALIDGLTRRIERRRSAPEVEVVDGGQSRYLLLLAAE